MIDTEIPELYRQTIGPLYAYVARRCAGERALAEDVVQETWLRAVEVWNRQGVPDTPGAWLTTVAHNLLVSHFRRRRPVALDAVAAAAALAVVEDGFGTASADVAKLIQWGLGQLSRQEAALLEAFYFDERSTTSIATDLRLSDRAVEGRLRRARLRLRRVIERTITKYGRRP